MESEVEGVLPFSLDDASRPEAELEDTEAQFNKVHLDTRLNNRVLDLRVCIQLPTNSDTYCLDERHKRIKLSSSFRLLSSKCSEAT